jgi:GTP cyclohydrolase II
MDMEVPQQKITDLKSSPVATSMALGDFFSYMDYDRLTQEAGLASSFGATVVMPENGFPLTSGKRGALLSLKGEPGPRQGNALVVVVGDDKDYRNTPTNGKEEWRPHSGCMFSLGGLQWSMQVHALSLEFNEVMRYERWERWRDAQLAADPSKVLSYVQYVGKHFSDLSLGLRVPTDPRNDCDCRAQGRAALRHILESGGGFFDLVDQEARGLGLEAKLAIYALQEQGYESDEACEILSLEYDVRDYTHCAQALLKWSVEWGRDLTEITLMTNNKRKHDEFRKHGIKTKERPHVYGVTPDNVKYMRMKTRHGHDIPEDALRAAEGDSQPQ